MKNLTQTTIRLIDIIISIITIILSSPIMILASLAIIITSHGPVFFVSFRRGFKTKKIKIIKFRTMKVGSETFEFKMIGEKKEPNIQCANDSRVTGIGKILRMTSVDELPQLFSIFVGDMSLVGPRPIIEAEYQILTSKQLKRFDVMPGLTGLAQVSGRSELPVQEALKKDLQWVKMYSLKNYLIILLKTAACILRKNAY